MPNWCENRLTITGDSKQLAKLKEDAVLKYKKVEKGEEKENAFSIAKLYPLPVELDGGSSPANIVAEKDYEKEMTKWEKDKKKAEKNDKYWHGGKPMTKKMSKELEKKFGQSDWYMWCIAHWGTKWDIRTHTHSAKKGRLDYDFDSAWSPPCSAFTEISKSYPKLTFKLKYCEPSMCFSGDFHVKNGKILYQCHHNKLKKDEECENCCDFIKE